MHESEIGLQAIVDPYARADFFISFSETGVNLEEGYITFTALPAGFVARGGEKRAPFCQGENPDKYLLPPVGRPMGYHNPWGWEDGIYSAREFLRRSHSRPPET